MKNKVFKKVVNICAIGVVAGMMTMMSGCVQQPQQPVYVQGQPQPVVVVQPYPWWMLWGNWYYGSHGYYSGGHYYGPSGGYYSGGRYYNNRTTVINNTTIVRQPGAATVNTPARAMNTATPNNPAPAARIAPIARTITPAANPSPNAGGFMRQSPSPTPSWTRSDNNSRGGFTRQSSSSSSGRSSGGFSSRGRR